MSLPRLAARPRPSVGRTVVLVPGFGADDFSFAFLRRFLRQQGHDPHAVGLGRISDDILALAARVADRAADVAARSNGPVALVGWSIGGILSREAARDHPDVIDQVITMGTPVEGGPSYTSLAWRYSETRKADIRAQIEERSRTPIAVPVTALWSRNDGVVTAEACIDHRSPTVEHIEVQCTHLGFGVDPTVFSIVSDRLAAGSLSSVAPR
jgi:triacylglycerol esterase/lipase EstA (alpha/beta hydrolase family)